MKNKSHLLIDFLHQSQFGDFISFCKIIALLAACFLNIQVCQAQSQTIIFTDYSEKTSSGINKLHFSNVAMNKLYLENSRLASLVQKSRGQGVRLINFSSQPSQSVVGVLMISKDRAYWPFLKGKEDRSQIEKAIADSVREMSDRDTLTLIINLHGNLALNYKPGAGYLEQKRKNPQILAHYELKEIIRRLIKPTQFVKVIANHCYGGDIHILSFGLTNTCSSSSVDVFHPRVYPKSEWNRKRYKSLFSLRFQDQFSHHFWDLVKEPGIKAGDSLFEAHLAGALGDFSAPHAELSSMAYLKVILNHYNNETKSNPYGLNLDLILKNEFKNLFQKIDELQEGVSPFPLGIFPLQTSRMDAIAHSLEEMENTMQAGFFDVYASDKLSLFGRLAKEWRDHRDELQEAISNLETINSNLHARRAKMNWIEKRCHLKSTRKAFDQLEKEVQQKLKVVRYLMYLENFIKNYRQFIHFASADEKNKFYQLLACELKPL